MSTGLKPKHQRMTLVVFALLAIVAAGIIAAWALRNQANYFYLPEQMAAQPPAVGQAVRLGGMVQPGSIKMLDDGITVTFTVTGNEASTIPVRYAGIPPQLIVEGSGVVAASLRPTCWPSMMRITCPANSKGWRDTRPPITPPRLRSGLSRPALT